MRKIKVYLNLIRQQILNIQIKLKKQLNQEKEKKLLFKKNQLKSNKNQKMENFYKKRDLLHNHI